MLRAWTRTTANLVDWVTHTNARAPSRCAGPAAISIRSLHPARASHRSKGPGEVRENHERREATSGQWRALTSQSALVDPSIHPSSKRRFSGLAPFSVPADPATPSNRFFVCAKRTELKWIRLQVVGNPKRQASPREGNVRHDSAPKSPPQLSVQVSLKAVADEIIHLTRSVQRHSFLARGGEGGERFEATLFCIRQGEHPHGVPPYHGHVAMENTLLRAEV
eukprot:scaffold1609_cov252-Pinguiococcus_pyrenoidosus.AAC.6